MSGAGGEDQKEGKEGVNLGVSGALAAETNTFNNVLVKYSEPPEARKPRKKWRLYVFKGRWRPEKMASIFTVSRCAQGWFTVLIKRGTS